jgi:sugar lactone lactonase YvrE
MRPGSFQSDHIVHATYFNAGLRIYDTTDPAVPREIACYVPSGRADGEPCQLNDLTVTSDGTIYVTDRAGSGLHILQPQLGLGQD